MENLKHFPRLDTINLSHNLISKIENCGSNLLGELSILNMSYNKLQTADDFSALSECLTLSVLDLSYNRIDDLLIVDVLAKMPELRVLVLIGNPVVSMIPSYRKTLINECVKIQTIQSVCFFIIIIAYFRINCLILIIERCLKRTELVLRLGRFFKCSYDLWYSKTVYS